ncbi:Vitamin B12 transporter BtuB [compost metagenome]
MKRQLVIVLTLSFLVGFKVRAQQITGTVFELNTSNKEVLLEGASISWINTSIGVISNAKGEFAINSQGVTDRRLIVSFVGLKTDTILVNHHKHLKIVLKSNGKQLDEVVFAQQRESTMVSVQPRKTEILTSKELKKAACCNLGESFQTNTTVDVTYRDGVTGSKELQVLGLAGAYTQILTENAPVITGLGTTYGIYGIPGTQIDQIHIVKGPGSVVFGPESISGMINVELKDPMRADKLFVNGYLDGYARAELNVDKTFKLSKDLSTLFSFHIDRFKLKMDQNDDSFLDMPMLQNINVLSKWKYESGSGWFSQNSIKYLNENREGGQSHFYNDNTQFDPSIYGQQLKTNRFEFYGRTGFIVPSGSYKSLGLQYSYVLHDLSGFYGLRSNNGHQQSINLRLIYNQTIGRLNSLNMGASYRLDKINEQFGNLQLNNDLTMPGVFVENTFSGEGSRPLSIVIGGRADWANGELVFTPRGNVKWSVDKNTDMRFSIGTGFKTANILAENANIKVSNREIVIQGPLKFEKALNYGFNINRKFEIDYRKGSIGVDLYRTQFTNKIIPDYDTDPTKVFFNNLDGKSYANNIQVEAAYYILKPVELKVAYKYLDVFRKTDGQRIVEPFVPKHRAVASLFYESFNRKWNANFTWQWFGSKKMPYLNEVFQPEISDYNSYSKTYSTINLQLTRNWKDFELYLGAENLLDFRQQNYIVGSANPNTGFFDASYIWGPVEGRRVYAGFRYKIDR